MQKKYGVYGDRLSFTEFKCRPVFHHLMTQFMLSGYLSVPTQGPEEFSVNKWITYLEKCLYLSLSTITTVFVDTRRSKRKHPRKRFQNFRQSCMLSTDRIEIHQSQPLVWPSDLDNTHDWPKFWKRFRGCFLFESRVSTKTVVIFSLK